MTEQTLTSVAIGALSAAVMVCSASVAVLARRLRRLEATVRALDAEMLRAPKPSGQPADVAYLQLVHAILHQRMPEVMDICVALFGPIATINVEIDKSGTKPAVIAIEPHEPRRLTVDEMERLRGCIQDLMPFPIGVEVPGGEFEQEIVVGGTGLKNLRH